MSIKRLLTYLSFGCLVLALSACPGQSSQPNRFTFDAVLSAEPGVEVTSAEAVISGLSTAMPATVTQGSTLLVNDEVADGAVFLVNGDRLQLRVMASTTLGARVEATVTVGDVRASFSVTTRSPVPAVVELGTDLPDNNLAAPNANVTLTWNVTGDYDSLVLTSTPPTSTQDVSSLDHVVVVTPGNVPSITYTLTARLSQQPESPASASIVLTVPLWVCTEPEAPITISDPALEARIRAMPSMPATTPLTCGDAQNLLVLNASRYSGSGLESISSLAGIQHFTNLTDLLLADNDIVDLSPVAGLTGLVRLDFDLNHVIDLTPVTGLTALEHLAFWDNGPQHYADFEDPSSCRDGVADLTPLTGLVNLRELYMSCNNISSIEPLAGISGLTRLYMISNLVEDLSPISDKAQIQVLRASDNPLEGGQVNLSGLTSLAWASLEYTSLRDSDLATLGALSHLFTLELEGNFLSDFSPVIDNPLFPASNGSGDPQEPNPASPLVSIAFNCLPDVGATQLALEAKGVTVMGGAPFPQRDPEACALASDVINGNALHLQRLAEFRKRVNSR